jgi:hypothetical protein
MIQSCLSGCCRHKAHILINVILLMLHIFNIRRDAAVYPGKVLYNFQDPIQFFNNRPIDRSLGRFCALKPSFKILIPSEFGFSRRGSTVPFHSVRQAM